MWFAKFGNKDGTKPAGKIEYRLVNRRTNLTPSKKKRVHTPKSKKVVTMITSTINEVIQQPLKTIFKT
jgi:hypothetical protein